MKAYYQKFAESYSPVRIAQTATDILPKYTVHSSRKNLLRGIGSVLSIFPSVCKNASTPIQFSRRRPSDTEAIASDWNRVGSYLWDANKSMNRKPSQAEHE
jgi:hypothetical protein